MLVLTRRIGEEIVIADNIRVTVVAINGRRVRVGITAPSSIPVARLELIPSCSAGTDVPATGKGGTASGHCPSRP